MRECSARLAELAALERAYAIGYGRDPYAVDPRREAFSWKTGDAHRHMMGLAHAAEQLVALRTGREWVNETRGRGPDPGDVDGIGVRWTECDTGGLAIRPGETTRFLFLPHALVTGSTIPDLRIRGWLYMYEVRRPEWYRDDWPYPAWSAPQEYLRSVVSLVRWAS